MASDQHSLLLQDVEADSAYEHDEPEAASILEIAPALQAFLKEVGVSLLLFALPSLALSCYLSYVSANYDGYSLERDWQECLVYADREMLLLNSNYYSVLPTAMSVIGEQTVVFVFFALMVVYRGLFRYDWLPSTLAMCAFQLGAVLIYYGTSPTVPFPTETKATLASLTYTTPTARRGRRG